MQLNVMVLESVLGPKFPPPWMGGQSSFHYWTVDFHYVYFIDLIALLKMHIFCLPYQACVLIVVKNNPAIVNFLVPVYFFNQMVSYFKN